MSDERELNPAAPAPALATVTGTEPIVEMELDRRAVLLGGVQTETCIQCGQRKAAYLGQMRVPGRFRAVDLKVALCEVCQEENETAFRKVGNLNKAVNGLYFAHLIAFGAGIAGSASPFLISTIALLFIGSWGASSFVRRRLLRDQPKLLEVKAATVRLKAPRAWARVLADENPSALVRGPES
jgi:hypothetical protein